MMIFGCIYEYVGTMLLCDVATCGSFIFRFDPQEVVAEPPRNRGKPQAFRGGVQQQCAPSFVVAAFVVSLVMAVCTVHSESRNISGSK
jgi:hypothetical protein